MEPFWLDSYVVLHAVQLIGELSIDEVQLKIDDIDMQLTGKFIYWVM
jgi:hypothetical protein